MERLSLRVDGGVRHLREQDRWLLEKAGLYSGERRSPGTVTAPRDQGGCGGGMVSAPFSE